MKTQDLESSKWSMRKFEPVGAVGILFILAILEFPFVSRLIFWIPWGRG